MMVKVRFFASLRELIGKREESVELKEGTNLATLLKEVSERLENASRGIYNEKGNINESLQFLVNGVDVNSLSGVETLLRNGDVIAIIPPVGGG